MLEIDDCAYKITHDTLLTDEEWKRYGEIQRGTELCSVSETRRAPCNPHSRDCKKEGNDFCDRSWAMGERLF
jgi:hypothetical protein